MRLKREIAKLEAMEKDIAQKASEIGPDTVKAARQCWSEPKTKTSFKELHR